MHELAKPWEPMVVTRAGQNAFSEKVFFDYIWSESLTLNYYKFNITNHAVNEIFDHMITFKQLSEIKLGRDH